MKIDYNCIDEEMRPIIKLLNSKGWRTEASCQGHWSENMNCYFGSFILFAIEVPKEYFPELPSYPLKDDEIYESKYRTPVTIVGCGYKNKIAKMKSNNVFYWHHTKYKRMNREDKDKEIDNFYKELYEWAENLPRYRYVKKVV